MKPFIQRFLERWFPPMAKRIRFRAIRELPLNSLLSKRLFEPELALIKPLLAGSTGLCLDVGAHVGEYCYALEHVVDPSHIHAFEPDPEGFTLLRAFFPKIHTWEMALSDEAGTAELRIPIVKNRRYATRGTIENVAESGAENIEKIAVERTTLDLFRTQLAGPVCFIKIDVEGHERSVIKGGMNTIQNDHPIMLVEIEERRHEFPIRNIFAEIETLGYRGFFLDLRSWAFSPVEEFDVLSMQNLGDIKSVDYINNFLFLPSGGADAILTRLRQSLGEPLNAYQQ